MLFAEHLFADVCDDRGTIRPPPSFGNARHLAQCVSIHQPDGNFTLPMKHPGGTVACMLPLSERSDSCDNAGSGAPLQLAEPLGIAAEAADTLAGRRQQKAEAIARQQQQEAMADGNVMSPPTQGRSDCLAS